MIEAEKKMQEVLRGRTLADLAGQVGGKLPKRFDAMKTEWFEERRSSRRAGRRTRITEEDRK